MEGGINTQQGRERLVDADGGDAWQGITAHAIDAFISMIQIQALEMFLHPRQFRKAAITDGPVGQQAGDGGENGTRFTSPRRISREEGRHQHLGGIGLVGSCLEARQHIKEMVEGRRVVAAVGIAHACQGTTKRDGGHVERAAIGGGAPFIHILDALRTVVGT